MLDSRKRTPSYIEEDRKRSSTISNISTASIPGTSKRQSAQDIPRKRSIGFNTNERPQVPTTLSDRDTRLKRTNSVGRGGGQRSSSNTSTTAASKSEEDIRIWHNIPLMIALVPLAAGLAFGQRQGSEFFTDLILLALSAVYLNAFITLPWKWYVATQIRKVKYYNSEEDIIDEELFRSYNNEKQKEKEGLTSSISAGELGKDGDKKIDDQDNPKRQSAIRSLKRDQLFALMMCFAGPVAGGLILHYLKFYVSRSSEGLFSSFNVYLFVLAGEMRPSMQVFRLLQERSLYLQSVVEVSSSPQVTKLSQKVRALEDEISDLKDTGPNSLVRTEQADLLAEIRRSIKPDMEAMSRAVRKFEKQETRQRTRSEDRLNLVEQRVAELSTLLSLSGHRQPAARVSVPPSKSKASPLYNFYIMIRNIILSPFTVTWKVVTYPPRAVSSFFSHDEQLMLLDNKYNNPGHFADDY